MKNIFISYSHKDEKWKDLLMTHLNVLAQEGVFNPWDDRKIQIGSDWLPEIKKALNEANIAILMRSADFLTSDFIRKEEIPPIFQARGKKGLMAEKQGKTRKTKQKNKGRCMKICKFCDKTRNS